MRRPVSDAIVFFGATGDLAYKQIFPRCKFFPRCNVSFVVNGSTYDHWCRQGTTFSNDGDRKAEPGAALARIAVRRPNRQIYKKRLRLASPVQGVPRLNALATLFASTMGAPPLSARA